MKPYAGKQLWIWELQNCIHGDPVALCKAANVLGLSGLIVKAWDGGNYWLQFGKIIAAAHKAGLLVGAWGYSYGREIPGEVRAMTRALQAGADWFVIDAEIEYEALGGQRRAQALLDAISASRVSNATIGYSTFDLPEMHPDFPYETFSQRCHVCMPQVYWAERKQDPAVGLHNSLAQCARYGLPFAPTGDAYGASTPEQIKAFGLAAKAAGLPGISFWSWQHATAGMLDAIKGIQI